MPINPNDLDRSSGNESGSAPGRGNLIYGGGDPLDEIRRTLDDCARRIVSMSNTIQAQQAEIDRLSRIVRGSADGEVTIRAASMASLDAGGSTLAVGERIKSRTGNYEVDANVLDFRPQAGKATQTLNFLGSDTTLKFNRCFTRADASMEIYAVSSFRLRTIGKASFTTGDFALDATKITVNSARTDFVRGRVAADTFVSNTMISAAYTPGAGNIW